VAVKVVRPWFDKVVADLGIAGVRAVSGQVIGAVVTATFGVGRQAVHDDAGGRNEIRRRTRVADVLLRAVQSAKV
jgi:hypothetical protein